MSLLTILLLSFFPGADADITRSICDVEQTALTHVYAPVFDIDSNDQVVFDLDQITFDGDVIEIPVFLSSDDQIFSLDFSMLLNVEALAYESVIDHTGELQFTAFFNPNDLKLRFTSNNFSPYPLSPQKVVSVRLRVLNGIVHTWDFQMLVAYLNGEGGCSSSLQLQGDEIVLANKEIITNETFIIPNPADDFLFIHTEDEGTLDVFDFKGGMVIKSHRLEQGGTNRIDVQFLPRGTYTARLTTKDQTVKTQRIVLQ